MTNGVTNGPVGGNSMYGIVLLRLLERSRRTEPDRLYLLRSGTQQLMKKDAFLNQCKQREFAYQRLITQQPHLCLSLKAC
jgi:hypothetical protein